MKEKKVELLSWWQQVKAFMQWLASLIYTFIAGVFSTTPKPAVKKVPAVAEKKDDVPETPTKAPAKAISEEQELPITVPSKISIPASQPLAPPARIIDATILEEPLELKRIHEHYSLSSVSHGQKPPFFFQTGLDKNNKVIVMNFESKECLAPYLALYRQLRPELHAGPIQQIQDYRKQILPILQLFFNVAAWQAGRNSKKHYEMVESILTAVEGDNEAIKTLFAPKFLFDPTKNAIPFTAPCCHNNQPLLQLMQLHLPEDLVQPLLKGGDNYPPILAALEHGHLKLAKKLWSLIPSDEKQDIYASSNQRFKMILLERYGWTTLTEFFPIPDLASQVCKNRPAFITSLLNISNLCKLSHIQKAESSAAFLHSLTEEEQETILREIREALILSIEKNENLVIKAIMHALSPNLRDRMGKEIFNKGQPWNVVTFTEMIRALPSEGEAISNFKINPFYIINDVHRSLDDYLVYNELYTFLEKVKAPSLNNLHTRPEHFIKLLLGFALAERWDQARILVELGNEKGFKFLISEEQDYFDVPEASHVFYVLCKAAAKSKNRAFIDFICERIKQITSDEFKAIQHSCNPRMRYLLELIAAKDSSLEDIQSLLKEYRAMKEKFMNKELYNIAIEWAFKEAMQCGKAEYAKILWENIPQEKRAPALQIYFSSTFRMWPHISVLFTSFCIDYKDEMEPYIKANFSKVLFCFSEEALKLLPKTFLPAVTTHSIRDFIGSLFFRDKSVWDEVIKVLPEMRVMEVNLLSFDNKDHSLSSFQKHYIINSFKGNFNSLKGLNQWWEAVFWSKHTAHVEKKMQVIKVILHDLVSQPCYILVDCLKEANFKWLMDKLLEVSKEASPSNYRKEFKERCQEFVFKLHTIFYNNNKSYVSLIIPIFFRECAEDPERFAFMHYHRALLREALRKQKVSEEMIVEAEKLLPGLLPLTYVNRDTIHTLSHAPHVVPQDVLALIASHLGVEAPKTTALTDCLNHTWRALQSLKAEMAPSITRR